MAKKKHHPLIKVRVWLYFIMMAGFILSCASDPNPVRKRQSLTVGQAKFLVEIADNDEQREMGLMFRNSMADNEGMLFVFPNDRNLSFWMKNTLIPLSIAYISAQGEIKEILDMTPQSLASVPSKWAVRYALEVPQGAFSRAGVQVGDLVILP